ncbi:hypothetical protein PO909_028432 [Leuciscus waleckii]
MFHTFAFCCLCCCCLVGMFGGDAVKSVSVMEGDSVTLNSDTELKDDDLIEWRFGTNGPLIAQINRELDEIFIPDGTDGRFRDRLKADDQTGSLTIMNTRTTDSGLYEVTIRGSKATFTVTVYACLSVPVIFSESPQNSSSSSSSCSLVCSVVNVSHVTLSWYKGISVLSSISVSDLNRSLSLHLECLDDSYSCVLNNPISNQTTYLNNTELCHTCPDCTFCCHFSETVSRLVISALVGVAAVFIVVYDITSRKVEQKNSEQT